MPDVEKNADGSEQAADTESSTLEILEAKMDAIAEGEIEEEDEVDSSPSEDTEDTDSSEQEDTEDTDSDKSDEDLPMLPSGHRGPR